MKLKFKMKKELFTIAWQYIKDGIFTTISEALKAAWNKIKLAAKLKKGIAYFSFKKIDGTVRNAIGTLNGSNYQYDNKGTGKVKNPSVVTYWDVEARAFRSFKIENFIKFN